MEILHLTDLHVTPPHESLEGLWSTAVGQLDRRKFDFIVVSGDLVQKVADGYETVRTFWETCLKHVLREPNARRVVFVPGNHDVDFAHNLGEPAAAGSIPEDEIKRLLRSPESSDLRAAINKRGELEIVRLDRKRYPQRMAGVQAFLDGFYAEHLRPPERGFNLTADDPGEHWSCHVFPVEGVAFFGFNSCHNNDRMWTGAGISARAVTNAAEHGRRHARDLLWIAVWHHGLVSDRGRPDHLTTQDVGFLFNNGFRLGFHGHTHKDEFRDLNELFLERFPIVATGSFAAGPLERPGGMRNQFAVVELDPSYMVIERFERDDEKTGWASHKETPYLLRRRAASAIERSEVDTHTRSAAIEEETGIAHINIRLEKVRLDGELTLATPDGAFTSLDADAEAETNLGPLAVVQTKRPDGRARFSVSGRQDHYEWITWSYSVSNSLSLSKSDLQLGQRDAEWRTMLDDDQDGFAHLARFRCKRLTLELRSQSDKPLFDPTGSRSCVLRRVELGGEPAWRKDESTRCDFTKAPERLTLTVEGPLVGQHYVIGYRPSRDGFHYPPPATGLIDYVGDRMREGTVEADHLAATLTAAIDGGLRQVLDRHEEPEWYGYLWHSRFKQLFACFGRVRPFAGAVAFSSGAGVVGHAFRMSTVATYFHTRRGGRSLIYQPPTTPRGAAARPFDWIVAAPILLCESGPAVGVVGLAGFESRGWDNDLRDYARQRMERRADDPELARFENELVLAVTVRFWKALNEPSTAPALSRFGRGDAARIYAELENQFRRPDSTRTQ